MCSGLSLFDVSFAWVRADESCKARVFLTGVAGAHGRGRWWGGGVRGGEGTMKVEGVCSSGNMSDTVVIEGGVRP